MLNENIMGDRRAIGWNHQGEVYDGKHRWDIILYPYNQRSDRLTIFSKHAPRGVHVVTDAKSAFTTAKTLYHKSPSKDLLTTDDDNGGLEPLTISPSTGQGGISSHLTPITKRPTAISGHKDLPNNNKQPIDGQGQVFPLR